MSLYIRTKMFQILEVTKKEEDTSFKDVSYWYKCKRNRYKMNSMHSDFVIKESENIEDLCDEFILFDDENKIHYQSQEGSIWWLGAGLYPKSVRGAIFTNEGIIYVAKLNENKELELI